MPRSREDVATAEGVQRQFALFDQDGSGTIEQHELAKVLQVLDPAAWTDSTVAALLRALDTNGDGCIQYGEFVDYIFGSIEADEVLEFLTAEDEAKILAGAAPVAEVKRACVPDKSVAPAQSDPPHTTPREGCILVIESRSEFYGSPRDEWTALPEQHDFHGCFLGSTTKGATAIERPDLDLINEDMWKAYSAYSAAFKRDPSAIVFIPSGRGRRILKMTVRNGLPVENPLEAVAHSGGMMDEKMVPVGANTREAVRAWCARNAALLAGEAKARLTGPPDAKRVYWVRLLRPKNADTKGDTHHLHIRQLEAFSDDGGQDRVALRFVEASPRVAEGEGSMTPHLAIDGDVSAARPYKTHSAFRRDGQNEKDHYMEFEAEAAINSLRLMNRSDKFCNRLVGSHLDITRGWRAAAWTCREETARIRIESAEHEYFFQVPSEVHGVVAPSFEAAPKAPPSLACAAPSAAQREREERQGLLDREEARRRNMTVDERCDEDEMDSAMGFHNTKTGRAIVQARREQSEFKDEMYPWMASASDAPWT